jgi:hypothetical protein
MSHPVSRTTATTSPWNSDGALLPKLSGKGSFGAMDRQALGWKGLLSELEARDCLSPPEEGSYLSTKPALLNEQRVYVYSRMLPDEHLMGSGEKRLPS